MFHSVLKSTLDKKVYGQVLVQGGRSKVSNLLIERDGMIGLAGKPEMAFCI